MPRSIVLVISLALAACATHPPAEQADAGAENPASATAAARLAAVADRFYNSTLAYAPEAAYFSGIELERHDGLADNSLAARRARERDVDAMLRAVRAIDRAELAGTPDWITHAYLEQQLAASVAKRVCHHELWDVNQMGGWHSAYAQVAQLQPVETAALRAQALTRWSAFPDFVGREIEILRLGLERGYSAPQTVVQRVVGQLDGMLALSLEQSPFYSMALRADDSGFAQALGVLVRERITPSLQRYRDYLAEEYLPQARTELSITANPDGAECYAASLRAYTTIDRSGREVYELGMQTVSANRARVVELGRAQYGLNEFGQIIAAAKEDPHERFESAAELLEFSRAAVARAEREMPNWVGRMPSRPVEVVPFDEHEEGTGRSAHYRPGTAERAGEYRIPLHEPRKQVPGNAETTAFHETWPGHHLQVAISQSVEGLHPATQLIWFSGPGEGWARYSEALAEEMDLYETTTAPILRRAWPARGMVVDPGIHLFGWTREQAVEFMDEAGRFSGTRAEEMVDRIAILPGQLTAYDSGGLEILALRREAEAALGAEFDLRAFHDTILEVGTIPLPALREHVERWIDRDRD